MRLFYVVVLSDGKVKFNSENCRINLLKVCHPMLKHSTRLWPSVPVYFSNAIPISNKTAEISAITWNLLANFEPPTTHVDDLCTAEAYFYMFDNMWAFIDNLLWIQTLPTFFSSFAVLSHTFSGAAVFRLRSNVQQFTHESDDDEKWLELLDETFCTFDDNEQRSNRVCFISTHPTKQQSRILTLWNKHKSEHFAKLLSFIFLLIATTRN